MSRIARALGPVFANPQLRRIELAFAAFNAAEWGVWIAMLVYAYRHGGTLAAGLVALAQLPIGALCPGRRHPHGSISAGAGADARLCRPGCRDGGDRGCPGRVRATAGRLRAGGARRHRCDDHPADPGGADPIAGPSIDELTGVNVVSGWIESLSLLVSPVITGALLAVSGPASVFAVMAGAGAVAAILVAPLPGMRRTSRADAERRDETPRPEPALRQLTWVTRTVMHHRSARVLIFLLGAQFVLLGALDVLFVVLAVRVLGLGGAGAGYLNAAFGAGGVMGPGHAPDDRRRGRRLRWPWPRLAWAAAFVALGCGRRSSAPSACWPLAGAARTLLDVTLRTLLQRTVSADVLARVFGLIETLDSAGLALGSILAPGLVALFGPSAAIAGLAVIFPALLLMTGPALGTSTPTPTCRSWTSRCCVPWPSSSRSGHPCSRVWPARR